MIEVDTFIKFNYPKNRVRYLEIETVKRLIEINCQYFPSRSVSDYCNNKIKTVYINFDCRSRLINNLKQVMNTEGRAIKIEETKPERFPIKLPANFSELLN